MMAVATAQLHAAFPEFARTGDAGKGLEKWIETVLRPGIEQHIIVPWSLHEDAVKRAAEAAAAEASAKEAATALPNASPGCEGEGVEDDDDMDGAEAVGHLEALLADAKAGKKVKRVIISKKVIKKHG